MAKITTLIIWSLNSKFEIKSQFLLFYPPDIVSYCFTHFIVCVYYTHVRNKFVSLMAIYLPQILRFICYFSEEELKENEGL